MKAFGLEVFITEVSCRHLVGLHFSGPHALHVNIGPIPEFILTSLSGLKCSLELEEAAFHTSESAW